MSRKEHTKSSICAEYLISRNTLRAWLLPILYMLPRLKENPKLQKLTPDEYRIIKTHLGEP
jgi:hypothetical protein